MRAVTLVIVFSGVVVLSAGCSRSEPKTKSRSSGKASVSARAGDGQVVLNVPGMH